MKSLSRRVLAVAVLACGLAVPARAAEVNPLIPAEAENIIFVNFRQIIDSQLVKKFALEQMKQALQGADAQKVMTDLGLDPLKDIDQLTGGFWGEDAQSMKMLIILSGKFDPVKLFNAADVQSKKDADKISIVSEGKYKFVKITNDKANGPGAAFKEVYISVANDKTILASTDKDVLAATMVRVEKNVSKPIVKKALGALMVKMDSKASFYMCGLSDPKKISDIPPNPLFDDPAKLKKQLEKIENMSMTLRIGDDVGLEATVGMKDSDAADEFGSTIDDMLGKVRAFLPLIAGQQPNLKPLIGDLGKNLKCKSKDKEVQVTLVLSGKAIAAAAGAGD
ncbi:MAG TPA: hypothetical protein VGJ05_20420 [Fimbriiglobus sp.]